MRLRYTTTRDLTVPRRRTTHGNFLLGSDVTHLLTRPPKGAGFDGVYPPGGQAAAVPHRKLVNELVDAADDYHRRPVDAGDCQKLGDLSATLDR